MTIRSARRAGLAGAITAALFAGLAAPAGAQAVPVRVVQGSDGALYLVQGVTGWRLVPDPISDEDLAAVDLGGEIGGTLPPDLLPPPAQVAAPGAATQPTAAAAAPPTAAASGAATQPTAAAATTVAFPAGGRSAAPVPTAAAAATQVPVAAATTAARR